MVAASSRKKLRRGQKISPSVVENFSGKNIRGMVEKLIAHG